jgi:bisphosphoglycerate-dependent phosphoglycerate mutase family 1
MIVCYINVLTFRIVNVSHTDHPYWHGRERKYKSVPAHTLPTTESLEDTIRRTEPMWHSHILPDLRDGRNVLIVAHRNSLRGILKIVDGLSTEDIQQVQLSCSALLSLLLCSDHAVIAFAQPNTLHVLRCLPSLSMVLVTLLVCACYLYP